MPNILYAIGFALVEEGYWHLVFLTKDYFKVSKYWLKSKESDIICSSCQIHIGVTFSPLESAEAIYNNLRCSAIRPREGGVFSELLLHSLAVLILSLQPILGNHTFPLSSIDFINWLLDFSIWFLVIKVFCVCDIPRDCISSATCFWTHLKGAISSFFSKTIHPRSLCGTDERSFYLRWVIWLLDT